MVTASTALAVKSAFGQSGKEKNMKVALVTDGVIVNIALVEGEVPDFLADWPEVTTECIGWVYDETTGGFVRPPIPLENTSSGE